MTCLQYRDLVTIYIVIPFKGYVTSEESKLITMYTLYI